MSQPNRYEKIADLFDLIKKVRNPPTSAIQANVTPLLTGNVPVLTDELDNRLWMAWYICERVIKSQNFSAELDEWITRLRPYA